VPKALGPRERVIDSFRHTFGTHLGESGRRLFNVGHGALQRKVKQKYVHPTPEAMEGAFERLDDEPEGYPKLWPNPFVLSGRGWRNW
jgi:hypothetical protein